MKKTCLIWSVRSAIFVVLRDLLLLTEGSGPAWKVGFTVPQAYDTSAAIGLTHPH